MGKTDYLRYHKGRYIKFGRKGVGWKYGIFLINLLEFALTVKDLWTYEESIKKTLKNIEELNTISSYHFGEYNITFTIQTISHKIITKIINLDGVKIYRERNDGGISDKALDKKKLIGYINEDFIVHSGVPSRLLINTIYRLGNYHCYLRDRE